MKGKDVVNALYKAMSENPDKKISDLFEIACKMPVPRFYVTFDQARRFVSMLDRGLDLPMLNPNRIAMYKELHRRLKKVRGNKEKSYNLLEDIILSPAPEFYMDLETFRGAFYKAFKIENSYEQ